MQRERVGVQTIAFIAAGVGVACAIAAPRCGTLADLAFVAFFNVIPFGLCAALVMTTRDLTRRRFRTLWPLVGGFVTASSAEYLLWWPFFSAGAGAPMIGLFLVPGLGTAAGFLGCAAGGLANLLLPPVDSAEDRAARGACINCGYDRAGLAPASACPECGTLPAN